jgi:SAM-dependent methyltransferase
MTSGEHRNSYLLGHSEGEIARLERQASLFAEATDDGLRRAGLNSGMRVLDLGCGAGDVTIAAARIVGPTGAVVGVDASSDAVAMANRRLAAEAMAHARCVEGDVFTVDVKGYDAIVGRFLLMHLPDPTVLLARFRRDAAPGTIVAFLEMDVSSASIVPAMPIFAAGVKAVCDVYRAGGAEPDMGSRLFKTFRAAALVPLLRGSCRVVGGDDPHVFDYLAWSVASLAPAMRAAGVDLGDIDPATFRDRLAAEAAKTDYCVSYPRFVCAWAVV